MEVTLYFKHFVKLTPLQIKLLPFVATVPCKSGPNSWAASTPTKARGVLFVENFRLQMQGHLFPGEITSPPVRLTL